MRFEKRIFAQGLKLMGLWLTIIGISMSTCESNQSQNSSDDTDPDSDGDSDTGSDGDTDADTDSDNTQFLEAVLSMKHPN